MTTRSCLQQSKVEGHCQPGKQGHRGRQWHEESSCNVMHAFTVLSSLRPADTATTPVDPSSTSTVLQWLRQAPTLHKAGVHSQWSLAPSVACAMTVPASATSGGEGPCHLAAGPPDASPPAVFAMDSATASALSSMQQTSAAMGSRGARKPGTL